MHVPHAHRNRPHVRKWAAAGAACGCAMGARFLAAALVLSLLWYGWHWRNSELSPSSIALQVLLISFLATAAGKLLGILLSRRGAVHGRAR